MAKARLIVDLDIKPDQVEAFVDMFRKEFISRSRNEDGCELYDLWQDPEQPEKLAFVEIWTQPGPILTPIWLNPGLPSGLPGWKVRRRHPCGYGPCALSKSDAFR